MNDLDIEKEVQAKGLTAPRVRLADIEDAIKSIDVVTHVSASGQILRWAVLNMRNGFAITGRPSCSVSPENDDAELGKKIATDNAISEAWALLGYELKSKLAAKPSSHEDRVRLELAELDRLSAFVCGPNFNSVTPEQRLLLLEQRGVMSDFVNVLARRVAEFPS